MKRKPPCDEFADIYHSYEAALAQQQMLDFDDLIVKTVRLFESRPDILQIYQRRFRWISVDEYQDVNYAQYRLLRLLTGPENNLCVSSAIPTKRFTVFGGPVGHIF